MRITNKILASFFLVSLVTTNAHAINSIQRVSLGAVSGGPDNNSFVPSVTSNSRYIVFESDATDLVTGDTNGKTDIFRYDRVTGTTIRVSVPEGGGQSNGRSILADISDDGRYVVFTSFATNLTTEPDTNGVSDIFLRDIQTGTTTLISKNSTGTATANGASTKPVISDDGTVIAYETLASDIIPSDTDAISDVYRYIISTGTTELVSTGSNGKGNARSHEPSLTFNGQIIAFSSDASNLGGPAGDMNRDVFFRDFNTGTTVAVTTGASDPGFTDSQQPVISADGSVIIFESFRRNLVANDNNGSQDVFAYDMKTGAITRVSVSSSGTEGDGRSGHPGVSQFGRYVVFESIASNLDSGDTNGKIDVFMHDRTTGKTKRISVDKNGNEGAFLSHKPKISSSGRYAVFSSLNGLTPDDTNGFEDIYLYERTGYNDFDGDGNSDILWRNSVSGLNKIYLMNGNSIHTEDNFSYLGDPAWQPVGIGDFDDDGMDDILWRNTSTGLNHISIMSGTSVVSSKSSDFLVPTFTDTAWKVAGVGDFNNDRFEDILWRNSTTGENKITLMLGAVVISELTVNTVADTAWQVAGVGDFNGDKKADILWRHSDNRRVWLYLMDSNTITNGGGAGEHVAFTGEDWSIQGVADFNNDGKADILWRNLGYAPGNLPANGRVWLYLMDGKTITNFTNLSGGGTAPGEHVAFTALEWDIKAIGDFNGDSKADVFWRNSISGLNWMYLMDGASITTNAAVNTLGDLTWDVVQDK